MVKNYKKNDGKVRVYGKQKNKERAGGKRGKKDDVEVKVNVDKRNVPTHKYYYDKKTGEEKARSRVVEYKKDRVTKELKKTNPIVAKVIDESKGSLNGDTTFCSPSNSITTANVNPNRVITVPLNANALFGPGLGAVMYAVQRGWASAQPTYPFHAINYIGRILLATCINAEPLAGVVPEWLSVIVQGLKPKVVKWRKATVAYNWSTDVTVENFLMPAIVPNGPASNSTNMAFGTVSNTNGINENTTVPFLPIIPAEYNAETGALAWASLIQYLGDISSGENRESHRLVPITAPNKYSKDASAFAASVAAPGGAFYNSGAPGCRKALEVPILTPALACFVANTDSIGATNRCTKHQCLTGGGSLVLGLLSCFFTPRTLRMYRQIKYKFIDGRRVIDAVAFAYMTAVQNALNDATMELVKIVDQNTLNERMADILPNITFLDFCLIMRNEMMQKLSGTQVFVQSLYPDTSPNHTFMPWTATSGTCALGGTEPMLLPILAGEIIKSYVARCVSVPNNAYKSTEKYELDLVVGVLGEISNVGLFDSGFYNVKVAGGPTYPLFRSFAGQKTPIPIHSPAVGKSKPVAGPKLAAEIDISLVDGSGNSNFYAINAPDALNRRVQTWNTFAESMSSYIQGQGNIGFDAGVRTSLDATDYIIIGADQSSGKVVGDIHKKLRGDGGIPDLWYGGNQLMSSTSFRDVPITTMEEQIPLLNPILVLSSNGDTVPIETNNYATLVDEFYNRSDSSTVQFSRISEIQYKVAHLMANDRDAQDNMTTVELKRANSKGQGGVLSSVLGALGGAAGNAVGDWIGI